MCVWVGGEFPSPLGGGAQTISCWLSGKVQGIATDESVGGNNVRLPRFIPMTLALLFCALFIVVVGHSEDHARNQ